MGAMICGWCVAGCVWWVVVGVEWCGEAAMAVVEGRIDQ